MGLEGLSIHADDEAEDALKDWLVALRVERGIRLHRSTVTVIDRPEGYREFFCTPPWFSQDPDHPGPELTEIVDLHWGDDPNGLGLRSDMWSASVAALRLRTTPADRLDLRERHVLGSRAVVGLNPPPRWLSGDRSALDAEDRLSAKRSGSMWDQFGMGPTAIMSSISGWDAAAFDPGAEHVDLPTGPAVGRWFRWSTLRTWPGWRRGQDAVGEAVPCGGELALFVSHRWELPDHPDPDGEQFQTLLCGLSVALASAVRLADPGRHQSASGLAELMAASLDVQLKAGWRADRGLRRWARDVVTAARRTTDLDQLAARLASIDEAQMDTEAGGPLTRIRERVVLWYDYSSMFQQPRTAEQERTFRAELATLAGVQRGAVTVALAPGRDYPFRGWCFLELAGSLRDQLVELRPEPDFSLRTSAQLVTWATRTDQLAGALATLGPAGIRHSGLKFSDQRDLPAVGSLLADLSALDLVRSDDSDMVGGALPYPRVDGGWVAVTGHAEPPPPRHSAAVASLPDPGRVPDRSMLIPTSKTAAGCDALVGDVGVWCFATTRTLALAWAARFREIWEVVGQDPLVEPYCAERSEPAVAAAWTDAWNIADDGEGMTRAIPSKVRLLVIVTQRWVSQRCLIRQSVLNSHRAAGVPVAVVHPFEGTLEFFDPADRREPPRPMDVWARPRMRRDCCRINQLFLDPTLSVDTVKVWTALRRQIWDQPLDLARLRASVEAHPEWGFATGVSDQVLLDQCSLRDLEQRIPPPD